MVDTLAPPEDEAAMVGSLLYISELIAERKKKYFPNLREGDFKSRIDRIGRQYNVSISHLLQ